MSEQASDVQTRFDGPVATVEICRPPHNFFSVAMIRQLADAFEALETDRRCCDRAGGWGSAFCAGADFSRRDDDRCRAAAQLNPIYDEALRMFACAKPVVAAVRGPAIGGGLGLALVADFPGQLPGRFSANFNRLGFHPGFGLSVTLPAWWARSMQRCCSPAGASTARPPPRWAWSICWCRGTRSVPKATSLAREIRDLGAAWPCNRPAPRCAREAKSPDPPGGGAKAPNKTRSSRPPTSPKASPQWPSAVNRASARKCRFGEPRDRLENPVIITDIRTCWPCRSPVRARQTGF
ncbi:MAG: enoyl-CoA hydratase/isomerase family protein [Burkholderiaceae bacterium]